MVRRRRAGVGARLEGARDFRVERGEGDRRAGLGIGRHRRQQVDVALDQRGLGNQPDRVPAFVQHFEHLARDAPFALAGLIRVCIHADGDVLGLVGWAGQFAAQQLGRVHLGEDAAFEIQPGREPEVAVGRPCEAIDAPGPYG